MVDSIRHQHKIVFRLLSFLAVMLVPTVQAGAELLPFRVGERLVYNARYLWFDAGRVEASIPEITVDGKKRIMHFKLHTVSTNTIASFFHMDDYFETDWDLETKLPTKLVIRIRETNTKKDKTVYFDHENGTALILKNSNPPLVKNLDPEAQNFLTSAFFTRTKKLELNDELIIPVFEDNKNYNGTITVVGRESVPIMGGMVNTIKILAKLKFEGAFFSSSNMYIWLTDDRYKIPVMMQLNIWIGKIRVVLIEASGVNLNIIPVKK